MWVVLVGAILGAEDYRDHHLKVHMQSELVRDMTWIDALAADGEHSHVAAETIHRRDWHHLIHTKLSANLIPQCSHLAAC